MDIERLVQKGISLSDYTSFGIGGPAKYLLEIKTLEEAEEALSFAKREGMPFMVVGKGSNALFDDKGYCGIVLVNKIQFIEWQELCVKVGSGYSFSLLGVQTARKGLTGLEFASGIPGSVGGAVFMNAGANQQEVSDTLYEVGFLNEESVHKVYSREQLSFSYRKSPFHSFKSFITFATFCLQPSKEARKKQLDLISYRTRTQPYGDKSAGCVFRNPKQSSAGALIEAAGLKGKKIGKASVSLIHANFIINEGGAKAQDVLDLAAFVKAAVFEKTGEMLEMEVMYIPYDHRG